eukprot:scaffold59948_cov60-Phaeocystis_antarctica.AAC.2
MIGFPPPTYLRLFVPAEFEPPNTANTGWSPLAGSRHAASRQSPGSRGGNGGGGGGGDGGGGARAKVLSVKPCTSRVW